MPPITNRIPMDFQKPYRKRSSVTTKIIFLSCEGCVTEEEYFKCIPKLFGGIESKIQFISVVEDILRIPEKYRTPEQKKTLGKNRPLQLVERIDQFRAAKEAEYEFSKYPDDEFWIITDVDNNWSNAKTNPNALKTYKEEWDEAVALCREKKYGYVVSNPFFEMWLLLHHDSPTPEDKMFAVTNEHAYEADKAQSHFLSRLREIGSPLRKKKHICNKGYTLEKVKTAIVRATELHQNDGDLSPHYFATTVYILVKRMIELFP